MAAPPQPLGGTIYAVNGRYALLPVTISYKGTPFTVHRPLLMHR